MFIFERDFFTLVVTFAHEIEKRHSLDFEEVLINYTPLYVRTLGFSDEHPIDKNNPAWRKIIASLPSDSLKEASYWYHLHEAFENSKKPDHEEWFGCFRYHYHVGENNYELHFRANDPQGNLSTERKQARLDELRVMFKKIKVDEKANATLFTRTWLLNVASFTRLFPLEMIRLSRLLTETRTQDNAYWGQFVNHQGIVRQASAQALLKNVTGEFQNEVRNYFPLKALEATVPIESFYQFYKI